MRIAVALAALSTLALPGRAAAHDLWLAPEGDALALRAGHRGGERLPVDGARVKAFRCLEGGRARDVLAEARAEDGALRVAARCAVASAFHDGGAWTLTPDGEVNRPRREVAQAVKAWTSRQWAKWVDVRAPEARTPLGDELELVPVTDLARARAGDKATVRVLRDGTPARGAVVAVGHHAVGETDSAGEARVKLRAPGLATLSATLRQPLATPDSDALVLEASLSFEVAR